MKQTSIRKLGLLCIRRVLLTCALIASVFITLSQQTLPAISLVNFQTIIQFDVDTIGQSPSSDNDYGQGSSDVAQAQHAQCVCCITGRIFTQSLQPFFTPDLISHDFGSKKPLVNMVVMPMFKPPRLG